MFQDLCNISYRWTPVLERIHNMNWERCVKLAMSCPCVQCFENNGPVQWLPWECFRSRRFICLIMYCTANYCVLNGASPNIIFIHIHISTSTQAQYRAEKVKTKVVQRHFRLGQRQLDSFSKRITYFYMIGRASFICAEYREKT